MKQLHVIGLMAAALLAGSFIASPELRAYAANTVFSGDIVDGEVKAADLANNAVTAAKVKDGEIKAAEIATDAVGAAELQGVTKLLFAKCALTAGEASAKLGPGEGVQLSCSINGVTGDDQVVATGTYVSGCFAPTGVTPGSGVVTLYLWNVCNITSSPGTNTFVSLIVFHK